MTFKMDDYVEVPERIKRFKEKYPDGFLTSEIVSLTESLVVVKAYAHRGPDDRVPATGLAAEPIPGKTPYTKDSEVMNCETSAWGRAIAALGFDFGKIASREEVQNRAGGTPEAKQATRASGDSSGGHVAASGSASVAGDGAGGSPNTEYESKFTKPQGGITDKQINFANIMFGKLAKLGHTDREAFLNGQQLGELTKAEATDLIDRLKRFEENVKAGKPVEASADPGDDIPFAPTSMDNGA